jgi:septum formation topological specificity factor MinE
MGLLDGFEKLINEHGSATILKERIELANDKYETLQEKNKVLEQKITQLEAENNALRLSHENAKIEIERLKVLTQNTHGSKLEELKESILFLLSKHEDLSAEQIGRALNQNTQLVMFHLTELENSELISPSYIINSPVIWSIAHEGRKYLVTHGLLV